jgi:Tfp pilus assembly protein PilO
LIHRRYEARRRRATPEDVMARLLQDQIGWCARLQRIMTALMIASAAMFYFVLYRPATARLAALGAATANDRDRLAADTLQARNLPGLQAEVYRLKIELEQSDKKLPRDKDLVSFMREITAVSQQSAVKKFFCQPGAEANGDLVSALPITMTFEGDFFSVFAFLRQAEEMERLTRIKSLTITSKSARDGLVDVKMAMNIYYLDN